MAANWRLCRLAEIYSDFIGRVVVLCIYLGKLELIKRVIKIAQSKVDTFEFGYIFKICLKILKLNFITEAMDSMKGVRFNTPHDYVCKDDRDLPIGEQTIFKVQYLDSKQQAQIKDALYDVSGVGATRSEKFLTGTTALKALEMGLKGWDNFVYADTGEEIPYSVENFSCIPPAQRDEIANHIRGTEEA